MLLPAVIVVLAALYPKFGFITRRVEGDVEEHREQILNAFRSAGFELVGEEEGVMRFRARGRCTACCCSSRMRSSSRSTGSGSSSRASAAAWRVIYRLDSYIRMKQYDKE